MAMAIVSPSSGRRIGHTDRQGQPRYLPLSKRKEGKMEEKNETDAESQRRELRCDEQYSFLKERYVQGLAASVMIVYVILRDLLVLLFLSLPQYISCLIQSHSRLL